MALAASRQRVTLVPGFGLRPVHVGFVVDGMSGFGCLSEYFGIPHKSVSFH